MISRELTRRPRECVAVVAAVNDDACLAQNLAASPMIAEEGVPLYVERGHACASRAYNAGLDRTAADVVVFSHQDVYLPRGWGQRLLSAVQRLEDAGKTWGVLGVVGVDADATLTGRVWSSGLRREIGRTPRAETPIVSIDELVIVLNARHGLRFDPRLPAYHLYGTDIVQTALVRGLGAYVFDGPVIHNSNPVRHLDRLYAAAYRYMRRKWAARLPLPTCVIPLTRGGMPLWRHRLRTLKRQLVAGGPRGGRQPDPVGLARQLAYEPN